MSESSFIHDYPMWAAITEAELANPDTDLRALFIRGSGDGSQRRPSDRELDLGRHIPQGTPYVAVTSWSECVDDDNNLAELRSRLVSELAEHRQQKEESEA